MASSALFPPRYKPYPSYWPMLVRISLVVCTTLAPTLLAAQATPRQHPDSAHRDTTMRDSMRMPMKMPLSVPSHSGTNMDATMDSMKHHAAQHQMADSTQAPVGGMSMTMGREPLGISMERMGSGTSWVPDATPMYASHSMLGGWELMLHGVAFVQYDDQGSKRGDKQFGSVNWGMVMAGHDLAGGRLNLRAMMSAEPFTVGSRGYPLLLQSGEAYNGQPLHDRQHPHDLFMELAVLYDHAVGNNVAVSLYAAPVGEPAIGPVAFPHRPSAASDPLAPIGHHWQDATHISFGVLTAGVYTRTVKLEGSIFNGREPDEIRTNFDYKGRSLDSYAGRVTVNPNENWSLSGSYAFLKSPEQLNPGQSLHRIVASALYGRPFGTSGDWASSLIYGANKHAGDTQLSNSVLAETNLELNDVNTVFGRVELAQKSTEDLAIANGMAPPPPLTDIGGSSVAGDQVGQPAEFNVGEITLGYIREITKVYGGSLGLGIAGTLNAVPSTLQSTYGTRTPVGATIFFRLRPGRMHMNMGDQKGMHGMKGMSGAAQ